VNVSALKREIADIRASLNLSVGHRLDVVIGADFSSLVDEPTLLAPALPRAE
jgi:hypothetical protein